MLTYRRICDNIPFDYVDILVIIWFFNLQGINTQKSCFFIPYIKALENEFLYLIFLFILTLSFLRFVRTINPYSFTLFANSCSFTYVSSSICKPHKVREFMLELSIILFLVSYRSLLVKSILLSDVCWIIISNIQESVLKIQLLATVYC